MSPIVAIIELNDALSISITRACLPFTVGRDPHVGLRIREREISRLHCELYMEDDVLCLRDTSTNGTFVGSRTLRGHSVRILDRTEVLFPGGVNIHIIPYGAIPYGAVWSESDERRQAQVRRIADRRQFQRRSQVIRVDFERRRQPDRRVEERRAIFRRADDSSDVR